MSQQYFSVVFRGIGQLAFIGSARAGLLFLLALACISPLAALGAFIASLIATGFHRVVKVYSENEWQLGISGYNAAVIGLLWSGMLTNGAHRFLWFFPLSLLLCFLLEFILRQLANKILLPVLTLPAVITIWITSLVFAHYGLNFWSLGVTSILNEGLVLLGILGILLAMSFVNTAATVQAGVLGVLSGWLANWYFGLDFMALSGLWGFSVVTASFGIQAVFFKGATSASLAGLIAAVVAAIVWFLWRLSPLGPTLPPLLFPFIVGTWATLFLARKMDVSNLILPIRDIWSAVFNRSSS